MPFQTSFEGCLEKYKLNHWGKNNKCVFEVVTYWYPMPTDVTAPIILADDDLDKQEFTQEAWKGLEFENELIFFTRRFELINYLEAGTAIPFLIISDINPHSIGGFDLK